MPRQIAAIEALKNIERDGRRAICVNARSNSTGVVANLPLRWTQSLGRTIRLADRLTSARNVNAARARDDARCRRCPWLTID